MLVLSRKVAESVVVGDDIVITVISLRGDRCRIGIDAPKSTPVDRAEIRQRKDADASSHQGHRNGHPVAPVNPDDDISPRVAETARRTWELFSQCRGPEDVARVIRWKIRWLGAGDALAVLAGLDTLTMP